MCHLYIFKMNSCLIHHCPTPVKLLLYNDMMLDYWYYKCVPAVTDERKKNLYGNIGILMEISELSINQELQIRKIASPG